MLIAAAALLIAMALFHSIIGERAILRPISQADNLPKIWNSRQATFRTLQATWHLVSILWIGIAAQLLAMSFYPERGASSFVIVFGAVFAGLAITPLVWNAGKHKTWIPFGLISILLFASLFV
ncbi:MAG: hypothetical protein AAFW81_00670 [Pseudomonadota bacterium]